MSRLLVSLLLVSSLGLGACSDDGSSDVPGGGAAAAVIKAGVPVDADGADDGSHLVLYRIPLEDDDEEPRTAWRLYDGGSTVVAEGTGGDTVVGTGDGFWLTDGSGQSAGRFVATDGTVRRLPIGTGKTQRGDVVIAPPFSLNRTVYSPASHQVFTPSPPPPGPNTQGWTLDPNGRQWAVDMRGTVRETVDGAWKKVRPVPVAPGQEVAGYGLTRVGEWLVVPVVQGVLRGEKTHYRRFAARLNGAPPSVPWRMIGPGPLAEEPRAAHPESFAVNDNHYVFWDYDGTPYELNMTGGRWTEIPLPTADPLWTLQPGVDGLYAFASEDSDATGGAWFSPDLGQSWVQMAR